MFTIERHGYSALIPLVLDVVNDLKDNGFAVKYPATDGTYVPPTSAATEFSITLETTDACNVFNTEQPWRICFEMFSDLQGPSSATTMDEPLILGVYVGTPIQLTDAGGIAYIKKPKSGVVSTIFNDEPVGSIGARWTGGPGGAGFNTKPSPALPEQAFYNRFILGNLDGGRSYPMSYRISITKRGLFIGIWQTSTEELGRRFHWLLVQHSVDKDTGKILGVTPATAASRCPVFCINSTQTLAGDTLYMKFIVREKDILGPSSRKIVTSDIEDNPAVLNPEKQVSFNEDGNYVITLLNHLTTPRFKYTTELDMVGTISADVVGDSHELDFTVYGEAQPRTYRALNANEGANTGMRLMVLVANPNE